MNRIAMSVATVAMATCTTFAMTTPAQAGVIQDGLVNVKVGDVKILNNAKIGVAAEVAATICGVKVGPVAILARQVDRTGTTRTVCQTKQGPVTIRQNH